MATREPPELADESVGELLKRLSGDTVLLMRQELDLVRAEMVQKGNSTKDQVVEEGNRAKTGVNQEVDRTRTALVGVGRQTQSELAREGKRAGVGTGLLGAGGVFGLVALGTLSACLIMLLDRVMPNWAAALVVTVAWVIVAVVLISTGRRQLQQASGRLQLATHEASGRSGELLQESKGRLQQIMQQSRKRLMAEVATPKPEQTIETLKEDIQWAKTQRKSDGK